MLEKVKNSLPILSIGVVIFSLIKQYVYYGHFNVPISYFLELSELPLLIAKDLIIIAPGYYLVTYILESDFGRDKDVNEKKANKVVNEKKLSIGTYVFRTVTVLIILAVVIYSIYSGIVETKKEFRYLEIIRTILLLLLAITPLLTKVYMTHVFSWEGASFHIFFTLLVFFGLFSAIISDLQTTIEGKYKGTIIVTDKIYHSNDSITYIGKTSSWVFIHNLKKKRTEIIPTSEIKLIDLKLKRN